MATRYWVPSDLSAGRLAGWWDPSDVSSVVQSGGFVSQLKDKSSFGQHLVQANTTLQPNFVSSGPGGLGSISFASGRWIGNNAVSGFTSGISNISSIFTVIDINDSTSAAETQIDIAPIGGYNVGMAVAIAGYFVGGDQNRSNNLFTYMTDRTPHVFGVTQNLTSAALIVDGTVQVKDTQVIAARTTAMAIRFGMALNGSSPANGSILGETILLSVSATDSDRQLIEGYLAWKWGTQSKLPATHTHKNAPPSIQATTTRPWTPADLGSDVALFIDASDTSTITYRTGNYVNTISSKVGSAVMYSPDSGHTPPFFTVNGHGALQTANNYGYLVSGGSDLSAFGNSNTAGTMIFVGKVENGAAYSSYFTLIYGADNRGVGSVGVNSPGSPKSSADVGSSATYTANGNIVVTTFTPNGSNLGIQIFSDGTFAGSGNRATSNNETITSITMLVNGANGGTGFMSAALYINRVLSTADRQLFEGWAAWKYNTVSQLPAAHPYKSAAPTTAVRSWVPTDLGSATLEGWYNLRDITGTFADGASLTQPTAGKVSQWNDSSGRGRHLYHADAGTRATYSNTGFDGTSRPAVITTASNQGFRNTPGVLPYPSKVMGGFLSVNLQSNGRGISFNNSSNTQFYDYQSNGQIPIYIDGQVQNWFNFSSVGSGAYTTNTPMLLEGYAVTSNTGVSSLDGGTSLSGSVGIVPTSTMDTIGILSHSHGDINEGPSAKLSEAVVIAGVPTKTDLAMMEGYLAWNNGTQSRLPATHAYKTAAPDMAVATTSTPAALPSTNASSNNAVSAISSTSTAKALASATVNATLSPVISLTPKIVTAPLQNGNFIQVQDGSLLDKIWAVADANSTPNANGSTYSFTQTTPPSITPVIQPTPNLLFDGVSLLLGPLNPTANSAQLINLTLRDQANAVVTTVPITLSQLSTDDMVWVTFKFPTPIMSTIGTAWSINLSTESSTPMIVNGSGTSFAMMLRQQGLTIPPMNATQSFYVLPDCSGSVTTGRNLSLNPDADTSINKLVVSQGCAVTFPSTNIYSLRVYDGVYDYTGSSGSDTGDDDAYQVINNDFDYGRSYGLLDNFTSATTVKAFSSATVNTSFQIVTGSGSVASYVSAQSNGVITPVSQSTVVKSISSAVSNLSIGSVLSSSTAKSYVSIVVNATIDIITSVSDFDVIVKGSVSSTLDNVLQSSTVLNYVSANPSYTIDPVISVSASQEFVTANFSVPIGDVSSVVSGSIVVQGSSDNAIDNVVSNTIAAVPGSVVANITLDNITQSSSVSVYDSASVNYTIDPITQDLLFRGYASANVYITLVPVSSVALGSIIVQGSSDTLLDNFTSSILVGVVDQAQASNQIGIVSSVGFAKGIVSANVSYTLWSIVPSITGKTIVQSNSNSVIDAVTLSETTSSIISSNSASLVDKVWSNASSAAIVTGKSSVTVGNFNFLATGRVYVNANTASMVDSVASVGLAGAKVTSNSVSNINNIISLCYSGTSYHAAVDLLMDNFTSTSSLSAIAGVTVNQVFGLPTMNAIGRVNNNVQLNNPIGDIKLTDDISTIAAVSVNQNIGSIVPSIVVQAVPSLSGTIQLDNLLNTATGQNYVSGTAHTDLTNIVSITSSGTLSQATVALTLAPVLNDMSGRVSVAQNGITQLDSVGSTIRGTVPAHVSANSFVGDVTAKNTSMQDSKGTSAVTIQDVLSVSSTSIIVNGKASNALGSFTSDISTIALTTVNSHANVENISCQSEAVVQVAGFSSALVGAFVANGSGTVGITASVPVQIDAITSDASVAVSVHGYVNETIGPVIIEAEGTAITKFVADCYIGDITCEITDLTPVQGGIDSSIGEFNSAAITRARFYFSTGYQMLI